MRIAYVAPTGKAAQVLRSKGNANAMTIHRLLYKHFPRKDGTFYRKKISTFELSSQYSLIIVDEVSMVPKDMWDLLMSHHIPTIACGDPGQLPAITEGTNVLDRPHIFLDEITRQAQESEIIRFTMDIRAGKRITPFKGKQINIVRKNEFVDGMVEWADVTLCSTNNTRRTINNLIRQKRYGEDVGLIPLDGETVICLKNNWDLASSNGDALVNGETGVATQIVIDDHLSMDLYDIYGSMMYFNFRTNNDAIFNEVLVDYKLLTTGKDTVNEANFKKFQGENGLKRPNAFDFGYCLTGWKAQGDEWKKVLVLEEKWPWEKEEKKRFLYTCATRASEKLTLVLNK